LALPQRVGIDSFWVDVAIGRVGDDRNGHPATDLTSEEFLHVVRPG
jgi:hypothetical protein